MDRTSHCTVRLIGPYVSFPLATIRRRLWRGAGPHAGPHGPWPMASVVDRPFLMTTVSSPRAYALRRAHPQPGTGRGTVLGLKLDRMADSVSGQTVVDPKGYLTDLKSIKISTGGWAGVG